jgi:hypothetical protein
LTLLESIYWHEQKVAEILFGLHYIYRSIELKFCLLLLEIGSHYLVQTDLDIDLPSAGIIDMSLTPEFWNYIAMILISLIYEHGMTLHLSIFKFVSVLFCSSWCRILTCCLLNLFFLPLFKSFIFAFIPFSFFLNLSFYHSNAIIPGISWIVLFLNYLILAYRNISLYWCFTS